MNFLNFESLFILRRVFHFLKRSPSSWGWCSPAAWILPGTEFLADIDYTTWQWVKLNHAMDRHSQLTSNATRGRCMSRFVWWHSSSSSHFLNIQKEILCTIRNPQFRSTSFFQVRSINGSTGNLSIIFLNMAVWLEIKCENQSRKF